MKMQSLVIAVLAAFLFFSGSALAERPPGAGNGGGGGDEVTTPDLGDLIILYRDVDGVPILTPDGCWQPIAFPSDTCGLFEMINGEWYCTENKVDPDCVDTPDQICARQGPCLVPVDPDTCAIDINSATCTQEVDFGRTNEVRSPDSVLENALADVIVNLATAACVSRDPSGRLVTSSLETVDGVPIVVSGAIDSPLQSLAIYKQLMLTGNLGIPLTESWTTAEALITAARAIGAASDKTGEVNVDMIAYLNQIMGLAVEGQPTLLGLPICIDVTEEVSGVVQTVRKCFLDYSAFAYNRAANFSSLPAPAYIPEDTPTEGTFEYLYVVNENVPTFGKAQGPILDGVFCVDALGIPVIPTTANGHCNYTITEGFTDGNIGGFAQAADDSRAVIDFMHTWPLPAAYATELTCDSYATGADVSISEESGLQVPTQMVDGSEGRDLIVTVANAGPLAATGTVTVDVEGVDKSKIYGVTLEDGVYIPDFADNPPWVFEFSLEPGTTSAPDFVKLFSVDFGVRTTITWTAKAVTDPEDLEVNDNNNEVTATTSVRVTGGGGGGRP